MFNNCNKQKDDFIQSKALIPDYKSQQPTCGVAGTPQSNPGNAIDMRRVSSLNLIWL